MYYVFTLFLQIHLYGYRQEKNILISLASDYKYITMDLIT